MHGRNEIPQSNRREYIVEPFRARTQKFFSRAYGLLDTISPLRYFSLFRGNLRDLLEQTSQRDRFNPSTRRQQNSERAYTVSV